MKLYSVALLISILAVGKNQEEEPKEKYPRRNKTLDFIFVADKYLKYASSHRLIEEDPNYQSCVNTTIALTVKSFIHSGSDDYQNYNFWNLDFDAALSLAIKHSRSWIYYCLTYCQFDEILPSREMQEFLDENPEFCRRNPDQPQFGALDNLVPLLDRVLVEKARGGIGIPEKAQQKVLQGTVVAVGPGARNNHGQQIPVTVKVGDKVLVPEYGGIKYEIEDKNYVWFKENELLAKLVY